MEFGYDVLQVARGEGVEHADELIELHPGILRNAATKVVDFARAGSGRSGEIADEAVEDVVLRHEHLVESERSHHR